MASENSSSLISYFPFIKIILISFLRYIILAQVKINSNSAADEYCFAAFVITLHRRIENRQENIHIAVPIRQQS